jgi:2'-5' RNA ligase
MFEPSASRKTHRLFFAPWCSDELQLAIERETCELVERSGGKPVARINYHATLAFLGSVAHERLPLVAALATDVIASRFSLQLDYVHAWRRSGILFLGSQHVPSALTQFAEALHSKLREHEFVAEERPFRLHVTLARASRLAERAPIRPIEWLIEEFVLVESKVGRGGSQYEVIGRWPLAA